MPWKIRQGYSKSSILQYDRLQAVTTLHHNSREKSGWGHFETGQLEQRKGGVEMHVVNQTTGDGVFGKSLTHDPSALSGASAIIAVIKGRLVKG